MYGVQSYQKDDITEININKDLVDNPEVITKGEL
jgi:hypothetical protein